jgi:hypothetical protein
MDNVFQRISKVMSDVEYLAKDDMVVTNAKTGAGYKAISEEKVTNEVRKALIKHGLVIVPVEMDVDREDEVLKDYQGNEKVNRITTADVVYRIQNIDDKDDYVMAVSSGTGVDTQDKGIGKAMTYAYKYLLLRTFAIPTGEDTDKISSNVYSEQFAPQKAKISSTTEYELRERIKTEGVDTVKVINTLSEFGYKNLGEIEEDKYTKVVNKIFKK